MSSIPRSMVGPYDMFSFGSQSERDLGYPGNARFVVSKCLWNELGHNPVTGKLWHDLFFCRSVACYVGLGQVWLLPARACLHLPLTSQLYPELLRNE